MQNIYLTRGFLDTTWLSIHNVSTVPQSKNMPLVTVTSDLGNCDYYAAALKGALLNLCKGIAVMDIANQVTSFDIRHAAYVVRHAYPYFMNGTIHVIYMNPAEADGGMIAVQHQNQYFLTFNNGITSLLFGELPASTFLINEEISKSSNLFFAEGFARVINHINSGKPLNEIGTTSPAIRQLRLMQPTVTGGFIKGSIQYFDKYGNAISNISSAMIAQAIGEKRALVSIAGQDLWIGKNYADGTPGELISFINAEGNLEVAINKGSALKLLGLRPDSMITVSAM
ncbi:MAG: SAM-dependent chlorinase/fluorinase [Chitinophagales bacterium]